MDYLLRVNVDLRSNGWYKQIAKFPIKKETLKTIVLDSTYSQMTVKKEKLMQLDDVIINNSPLVYTRYSWCHEKDLQECLKYLYMTIVKAWVENKRKLEEIDEKIHQWEFENAEIKISNR